MNPGELKQLWREKDFHPSKRLGQNFLLDSNVISNLLSFFDSDDIDVVLEIGPGFGAMTFGLAEKCRKLIAVEKDRKIFEIMSALISGYPQIELILDDFMEVDFSDFVDENDKIIIYGNIPYNISTPIIEKIIHDKKWIKRAYLVMQEEVVDRIISSPGTKKYGSLSCFVQYHTTPGKLLRIKKNSFFPVPKVESALLKLDICDKPNVDTVNETLFFDIIRKAFSQRRKKAINPLIKAFSPDLEKSDWEQCFTDCNIELKSRAENLSLDDYARLTEKVNELL